MTSPDKHSAFPITNIQEQNEAVLTEKETINGLPVISAEDFSKFYSTDIRAMGSESSTTFNFQGYVRETRPGRDQGVFYKDVLATNGILKDGLQVGIHIGTDGVSSYRAGGREAESQSDIREYDIYITVPGALQKKLGIVCHHDSCMPRDVFKKHYADYSSQVIDSIQSEEGWIVYRSRLEPATDNLARIKAESLHQSLVAYIESGKPLDAIEEYIRNTEDMLDDIDESKLKELLSNNR